MSAEPWIGLAPLMICPNDRVSVGCWHDGVRRSQVQTCIPHARSCVGPFGIEVLYDRIVVESGYLTPEEAALAGFDPRYARVVRTRDATEATCGSTLSENEVEVELATNDAPYEYPYFVHVERIGERWREAVSHN
jgi:hypothetical protein